MRRQGPNEVPGPTVYDAGYAAGLKEGARRERRSNLRIFDDESLTTFEKVSKLQRRWLKAERDSKLAKRALRSKRGEGRDVRS